MSAGVVRAFLPTLRELERQLALPIPDRVRILRELEYDLEELADRFMAQGLPAAEARARALDALVPDRATLGELSRLHAPLYRRVTRGLKAERLRILERSALVVAAGSVLVVEAFVLARTGLFRDPSPFLWVVLTLGALLFTGVTVKVFELWIKGDHRVPHRGLGEILGLCGVTLGVGIGGAMFDFYRLAAMLEAAPVRGEELVPQWLIRDATLLSVALLVALGGALAWFVLGQWLAAVARSRHEVLGTDTSSPSNGEQ